MRQSTEVHFFSARDERRGGDRQLYRMFPRETGIDAYSGSDAEELVEQADVIVHPTQIGTTMGFRLELNQAYPRVDPGRLPEPAEVTIKRSPNLYRDLARQAEALVGRTDLMIVVDNEPPARRG